MLTISSEADWSFAFVGEVEADGARYSYRPRSDYMLISNNCPLLLIEIHSNGNDSDRSRMLLQGGMLVRVMNSIKKQKSFVAMAIYVTDNCMAERYLMYQPPGTGTQPEVRFTDSSMPDFSSFIL